jgi:hypothetical protein
MLWRGGIHRLLPDENIRSIQDWILTSTYPKKYGIADPILVYQMGKVGSRSVYESLRQLELNVPVYHLHILNYFEVVEKGLTDLYGAGAYTNTMLKQAKRLRAEIDKNPDRRLNIISLTRTPVTQEISAFFHRLDAHFPDYETRSQNISAFAAEVAAYFATNTFSDISANWFDLQVRQVFGLDVYATPFPRERGYVILEQGNLRMLVLRMEDLNRCATTALEEFLGIPDFRLTNSNVAESKPYGKIYQETMRRLQLSPEYIQHKHSTRYARHFYSPEELAASVARWVEPGDRRNSRLDQSTS